MAELWYPEAVRVEGPTWKQEGTGWVNIGEGAILHSMVGAYEAALARLQGEDRVSWHFSVRKDGRVIQHYPVRAVLWHAGNRWANQRLVGIEHEGGAAPEYSEPLTEPQLAASARLVAWLGKALFWPEYRVGKQLWEHNWLAATACPSGRIPWTTIRERISEMTEVDQVLRDRIRVAAAFRQAAAVLETGGQLSSLPKEVRETITYVVRLSGLS